MEIDRVDIDDVTVGTGRRDVDPKRVQELAESITKIGLMTPISVWLSPDREAIRLVAGRHRLEAYRLLGRQEIDCIFVTLDEIDRELWEISENLHRAELTVNERAENIAKWIRLTEERESAKAQLAPLNKPHDRGRPNQGINAASRELGIDRTEAQRAIKIDALPEEVKQEAKALQLDDNQTALLKAVKHQGSKEEQIRALREHAEARRYTITAMPSPSERRVERAQSAVNALSPDEFEVFDEWYKRYHRGNSVADNTSLAS